LSLRRHETPRQEGIRALFSVVSRYVGNLAPMRGVFPDYPAPVIRNAGSERELVLMRWGMPPPPRTGGPTVTNIRNMPGAVQRLCRIRAGAEPRDQEEDVVWFAINDDRPLACFAGIWTEFKSDRGTKSKPILGPHQIYGFLTTSPNVVVEPIHPKAIPVILLTDEEREVWMRGRCSGHCPTMRSGSSLEALTRKTRPLHEIHHFPPLHRSGKSSGSHPRDRKRCRVNARAIQKINEPLLFRDRGSPAKYGAGLNSRFERSWLILH
jgi:putative SOS response-associated peptidase YedK